MNSGTVIAKYPEFSSITVEMRPILHPRFHKLKEGISEFTFVNIYLFRKAHSYLLCPGSTG
ncbi:MAG: ABC transporter permease, partial [Desulfobacteraceae bacterium]|nr:ABC transporter permease [Desulfobacteraceae bacterium]